jgi:Fur family ferric uptake transcriptional regulator
MARRTAQRAAIRQVFEEAGRPLGPVEILRAAQVLVPRLGLTTVYRTVNSLVEEGWLTEVELPGEASRYELNGKGHHHHFRCRRCNCVYDVEGCADGIDGLVPKGFAMQGHAIVLYGTCEACKKASTGAGSKTMEESGHAV